MYTVYVIESLKGSRYTGHTNDLPRRLSEHNNGLCKTTKANTNWQIIYAEIFQTRGEALKRERWLKSGVGREYLKQIMENHK